jgi:glycerophosphoryl diester phosphodiesterase
VLQQKLAQSDRATLRPPTEIRPAVSLIQQARRLVIAHRGYCNIAPENTLPAFGFALACGVDLVELDVRQSKDGEWLAIHDAELDRTTDARRTWHQRRVKVKSRTSAEIRQLDAGHWFAPRYSGTRVPLLSEAVEMIGRNSIALIEHKAGGAADLVAFLRRCDLINKVVLQSFDWEFLRTVNELEPEQVLGALGPAHRLAGRKKPLGISRKLNKSWLNQAAKTGARVIVWNRKVSKRAVRLAHERGLKVWVYTVNNTALARRLLRADVDGLITNDPPTVISQLR